MFDSLLGRKFSARCKISIKCIKERIFLIRKKKLAMLNFLKKDIADLLANGHDDVALGRTEGLIAEMNHTSCYDMIEKFCEYVLKQLPCLQKQRECPQEDREALSTLIFAAARFSDLPELCDLRRVFTVRYGCAIDSSVNSEFVEKTTLKSFSMDRKLQLMRDIVQEFSIKWDFEAFKYRMYNPTKSASGRPKKVEPLSNVKEDRHFYESLNGRNENATNVSTPEISTYGIRDPEPVVGALKYVQREPKDVHVISGTNNGSLLDHIRKTNKVLANEPENVEPFCAGSTILNVRRKGNRDENQRDDPHVTRAASGRAARAQEELDPISQEKWIARQVKNKDDKPVNLDPPYTKPAVRNTVNHREDSNEDVVNDKPLGDQRGSDSVGQVRESVGQGKSEHDRVFNMVPPPYIKPKGSYDTKASDPAIKVTARGGSNLDGEQDMWKDDMVGDGKPKPRSVRRKPARSPKVHENENAVDNSMPEDQVTSGRRKHGVGQSTPKFEDSDDEEEKFMDRLLRHYSKKGMAVPSDKSRTRKKTPPTDHVADAGEIGEHKTNGRPQLDTAESVHAPARVVSLPPEPVSPIEGAVVKGHVRAASMQPDSVSPKGARVHPRLPDYDELAARFIALKKGG